MMAVSCLQGEILHQDPAKGIIMSTQSLVLQKVDRTKVGTYVCRAVNSEGVGEEDDESQGPPHPLCAVCSS